VEDGLPLFIREAMLFKITGRCIQLNITKQKNKGVRNPLWIDNGEERLKVLAFHISQGDYNRKSLVFANAELIKSSREVR
jgi:hypothetical protein